MMKRGYRCTGLDYAVLADWCRTRRGQVMVCEQDGAEWLPFVPFRPITSTANTRKLEVIWTTSGDVEPHGPFDPI